MPGGNRTGPMGRGPMSGRAAGYCAGYDVPGSANPVSGRRFGLGWGGGWGRGRRHRHWFQATGFPGWVRSRTPPMTGEREAEDLQAQAKWLQEQLDAINQRVSELGQEA
jgi:hypothetical protein